MTTPEQPADTVLDELVQDCADRVSRSVRVTGPPNMETCEDLPNAFAYWEKDSLQEIIREYLSKSVVAKEKECEKEAGFRVVLMQTLQLLQSRASPIPCTCGCEGCRGDREAIRSYIGDWQKQLDRIDDGDFGPADQAIAANIKRIAELEVELKAILHDATDAMKEWTTCRNERGRLQTRVIDLERIARDLIARDHNELCPSFEDDGGPRMCTCGVKRAQELLGNQQKSKPNDNAPDVEAIDECVRILRANRDASSETVRDILLAYIAQAIALNDDTKVLGEPEGGDRGTEDPDQ